MSNHLRLFLPSTVIVGDNVSSSMELAYSEAPFPQPPPGRVVAISGFSGIGSVSVGEKSCILSFSPFSGPSDGFNLVVDYDPA